MTGEPGDLKNCDVTKVKLINLKNYQIYCLDFRLLLFQPENVGKIDNRQSLINKKIIYIIIKLYGIKGIV